MKVVIDLPDKNYEVILTKIMLACRGCKITELPKGHGRLIDADELKNEINQFDYYDQVCDAPTIIEADTTESEDKECK